MDSPIALPVQSLVTTLKGLANSDLAVEGYREFPLPHKEDREDLAEENEMLLSDMVVLSSLASAKKLEANFES